MLHCTSEELTAIAVAIDRLCHIFSDNDFITIINFEKKKASSLSSCFKNRIDKYSRASKKKETQIELNFEELSFLKKALSYIGSSLNKTNIENETGIQYKIFEEIFSLFKTFTLEQVKSDSKSQVNRDKGTDGKQNVVEKRRKLCELKTELFEIKLFLQKLSTHHREIGIILSIRDIGNSNGTIKKTSPKEFCINQLELLKSYVDSLLNSQAINKTFIFSSIDDEEIFTLSFKDSIAFDNHECIKLMLTASTDVSCSKSYQLESLVSIEEMNKFSESIHDAMQVLS